MSQTGLVTGGFQQGGLALTDQNVREVETTATGDVGREVLPAVLLPGGIAGSEGVGCLGEQAG